MKKFTLKFISVILVIFGVFFAQTAVLSPDLAPLTTPAFADEEDDQDDDAADKPEDSDEATGDEATEGNESAEDAEANEEESPSTDTNTSTNTSNSTTSDEPICNQETGSVSWIICSVVNVAGNLVDRFYELIEKLLIVEPISTDTGSAIYQVWRALLRVTNIVFIIFMIIIIYSQLTGLGIDNYGIKRALPRLIIAAILVNLSYFICSVAVDVSNIIGSGLDGILDAIQQSALQNIDIADALNVSWSDFTKYLTAGVTVTTIAIVGYAGVGSVFWAVVIALIGAFISLAIGLITIALRQGLIIILVMVAPLAFVAYLLPNTEKWFQKWKELFFQMLVFYPMFSLLFGASKLAGWAIITGADKDPVRVLIGLAVQVMPIFLSFSLFKMSGNVLGSINAGLHRLATPMQRSLSDWAASHQEHSRALYLGNQYTPGSKLRGYLDYRRALREADIEKATQLRNDRAKELANHRSASYLGLDRYGNPIVGNYLGNFANSHSQLQKRASLAATRAAASQQLLDNNLSDYSIFRGQAAKQLSAAHARAFEDSMMQTFRAVNIAQGDQSYLLNRYFKAAKDRDRAPYEFNRLIRGATGGIAHDGEVSIIGQVLDRSVQLENQRRREAAVVSNKFGYSKSDYRAMVFNKARINDDGYEETADGTVIENPDFKYFKGKEHLHRDWPLYIAVHKRTGVEIEGDEYDSLTDREKKQYRKVRYMNIKDDDYDNLQRVFFDDAGFMKEMLTQDIAIGDPINVRYLNEIGLKRFKGDVTPLTAQYIDQEKTGLLRRYHSTITSAMLSGKYNEHNAAVTAMLLAQANNGYITTPGQYHIAEFDSLWKAAKSGKILQNDAPIIRGWIRLLNSLRDDAPEGERFEDIISDGDLALSRNINGLALHGDREVLNADGTKSWERINRYDPTITPEEKRNFIRRVTFHEVTKKLVGSIARNPSPNILDSQKPDATLAFLDLAETAANLAEQEFKRLTPEERRDPKNNILSAKDPTEVNRYITALRNELYQRYDMADLIPQAKPRKQRNGKKNDGVPLGNHEDTYFQQGNNGNSSNNSGSGQAPSDSGQGYDAPGQSSNSSSQNPQSAIDKFDEKLKRSQAHEDYYNQVNSIGEIENQIDNIFNENPGTHISSLAPEVKDYINSLDAFTPNQIEQIEQIIDTAVYSQPRPTSIQESINQFSDDEQERINNEATSQLHDDLFDFINSTLH